MACIANANQSISKQQTAINDRLAIYHALKIQNVFNKDRKLVHLTHACNLVIDNTIFHVTNIIEHVVGAQAPRGIARIFVLDSELTLKKQIAYDGVSYPLYCKDNNLYLFGYITIDGLLPEGNVLSFSNEGTNVTVKAIETNDFPSQLPPQ